MKIRVIVLMVCVGILASGCSRLQHSTNTLENRRFNILVKAKDTCEIDFDVSGRETGETEGNSKEFNPDSALEIITAGAIAE